MIGASLACFPAICWRPSCRTSCCACGAIFPRPRPGRLTTIRIRLVTCQGWRDDDPVGQRGLTCSTTACDPGYTSDGALVRELAGWRASAAHALLIGTTDARGWGWPACTHGRLSWSPRCQPSTSFAQVCYENCRSGTIFISPRCYDQCPSGWDTVLLNCQVSVLYVARCTSMCLPDSTCGCQRMQRADVGATIMQCFLRVARALAYMLFPVVAICAVVLLRQLAGGRRRMLRKLPWRLRRRWRRDVPQHLSQ